MKTILKEMKPRIILSTIIVLVFVLLGITSELVIKSVYTLPDGKIVDYTANDKSVKLVINEDKNASEYQVYYKLKTESNWSKTKANSNICEVTGLKPNTEYVFKTRLLANQNASSYFTGSFSTAKKISTAKLKLYTTKIVSYKQTNDSIDIKYQKVSFAKNYKILYKKTNTDSWQNAGITEKTNFTINKLNANTSYQIKVKALSQSEDCVNSDYSKALSVLTEKTVLSFPVFKLNSETKSMTINFYNNQNIGYYKILFKSAKGKWKNYKSTNSSFYIDKLKINSNYYVKAQAIAKKNSKYKNSKISEVQSIKTKKGVLSAPTNISVNTYFNTVSLGFNNATNANKYAVYYKGGTTKKWNLYENVKTNSAVVGNLSFDTTYQFKLKSKDSNGDYSDSNFSTVVYETTTSVSVVNSLDNRLVSLNNNVFYSCSATGGMSVVNGKSGFVLKGQSSYTGDESYKYSQKVAVLYYFPNINESKFYTYRLTDVGHGNGMATDGKNLYITAFRKYYDNGVAKLDNKNKIYCVSISTLNKLKQANKIVHIDNTKYVKNYRLISVKLPSGKDYDKVIYQIAYKGNNRFVFNYKVNGKKKYKFFIEGKLENNKIVLDYSSIIATKNNTSSTVNQDIGYVDKLGLFVIMCEDAVESKIDNNNILWLRKNDSAKYIKILGKSYPLYSPVNIKINSSIFKSKGKLIFKGDEIYKFTKVELESIDIMDNVFYLTCNCTYYKTKDDYKNSKTTSNDVIIKFN